MEDLFVEPRRVADIGRPIPSAGQRIALCRGFAEALSFYHDQLSVVFGGINARNELFGWTVARERRSSTVTGSV